MSQSDVPLNSRVCVFNPFYPFQIYCLCSTACQVYYAKQMDNIKGTYNKKDRKVKTSMSCIFCVHSCFVILIYRKKKHSETELLCPVLILWLYLPQVRDIKGGVAMNPLSPCFVTGVPHQPRVQLKADGPETLSRCSYNLWQTEKQVSILQLLKVPLNWHNGCVSFNN